MLLDIEKLKEDPMCHELAKFLSPRKSNMQPIKRKGFFAIGHFNFNHTLRANGIVIKDEYPVIKYIKYKSEYDEDEGHIYCGYGVCDSPEQFIERYADLLEKDERLLSVSLTIVPKDESNRGKGGGWRWHKWGPYIGDKKPSCEYIDDEGPEITQACCFHIHHLMTEQDKEVKLYDNCYECPVIDHTVFIPREFVDYYQSAFHGHLDKLHFPLWKEWSPRHTEMIVNPCVCKFDKKAWKHELPHDGWAVARTIWDDGRLPILVVDNWDRATVQRSGDTLIIKCIKRNSKFDCFLGDEELEVPK